MMKVADVRITFQKAESVAAQLRLEGATAMTVAAGETSKLAAAAAAGISRPTLDRWIERTEAGQTLTVDWGAQPDEVTLAGIRVAVHRDTAYLPSHYQADVRVSAGRAWFLSLAGSGIINPGGLGSVDLEHTIIQPDGLIVFEAAYLDAAVVYLVSKEQARQAAAERQRQAREDALAELSEADAHANSLTGQGGVAMDAREHVQRLAHQHYAAGHLTDEDARRYLGASFNPAGE